MIRWLISMLFTVGQPEGSKKWALYIHHLGDYMHRWIFRHPWGTVRVHHILRSDADRHLHDHPFDFTSILLTHGYEETRFYDPKVLESKVGRWWPRWSIVRKRAEDAHLLRLDRPVWTLVFSGPKRREWGFHTERGWVHHRDYSDTFPEIARVG